MKNVPKICQHLESRAHGNLKVSNDRTFPGWLKIDGQNHTAVLRSEVEPNPPDEEEVEIDETKSNSVETEMPNDGNSQTEEDVMPSNVGNSERWDAFNDENLQTQESMVIVFDSGGKWWALMNLTGLVDWLIRNI